MIRLEDRRNLALDIEQAHAAGARLQCACEIAGIDVRTLQRWRRGMPSTPMRVLTTRSAGAGVHETGRRLAM